MKRVSYTSGPLGFFVRGDCTLSVSADVDGTGDIGRGTFFFLVLPLLSLLLSLLLLLLLVAPLLLAFLVFADFAAAFGVAALLGDAVLVLLDLVGLAGDTFFAVDFFLAAAFFDDFVDDDASALAADAASLATAAGGMKMLPVNDDNELFV